MAESEMYAVNGDLSIPKPRGVSEVYIVNGDTSVAKPKGVSPVYAVNGDTSIPKPRGVSPIYLGNIESEVARPAGVSVVKVGNFSVDPLSKPIDPWTFRFKFLDPEAIDPTVNHIGQETIVWKAVSKPLGVYDATVPRANSQNRFGVGTTALPISIPLDYSIIGTLVDIIGANTLNEGAPIQSDNTFNSCTAIRNCDFAWEEPSEDVGGSQKDYGHTYCFAYCTNLIVPPRYERAFSTLTETYRECTSLKTVPIIPLNAPFKPSSTMIFPNLKNTFNGCTGVESGALSYYNYIQDYMTENGVPATKIPHTSTFYDCGSGTVTGAADLAQIPTSWGGTMA